MEASEYNGELVRKYKKEMSLRKKFHNMLVELRGTAQMFTFILIQKSVITLGTLL